MSETVKRLSNSELQTFKRCRRKWYLSYYRQLKMKNQSSVGPLALGSRIHNALEAYYTDGQDLLKAHSALLDLDRQILVMDQRDVTDLEAEGELGRLMLEGYIEWLAETGADSGWEVIDAERVVSIPLFEGEIELRGKLDMRVRRLADDVTTFIDHKAVFVDHTVLTPNGYRRIGDASVGDEVIAPDGSVTVVTGVYPQGVVPLNRVTFSDKSSVLACDDHLWEVREQHGTKRILNTKQIKENGVRTKHSQHRYDIPLVSAGKLDLGPSPTALDPYALGVVLGDGIVGSSPLFCSWDPEIADEVERCLTSTQRLARNPRNDTFAIREILAADPSSNTKYLRSPLTAFWRDIGLAGKRSYEKFIPESYKYAPAADRLSLLQGLMDTDGFVKPVGKQIGIGITSEQLRDDVAWLVRSLGGYATPSDHGQSGYKNANGEFVTCREVYGVAIRMPDGMCPFRLPRKVQQWESVARRLEKRKIVSIEPEGTGEAICIEVAHPDHLYVIDDFIVTHNTCQNFSDLSRGAYMDEQFLTYHMLESMDPTNQFRSDGGIYNMLRKVKRTQNARPPFYERLEVRHNKEMLRSFWLRIHGEITEIMRLKERLDAGADHRMVAYPTPNRNCSWDCDFVAVCPLFDDGSAAESMIDELYRVSDPDERYNDAAAKPTVK